MKVWIRKRDILIVSKLYCDKLYMVNFLVKTNEIIKEKKDLS